MLSIKPLNKSGPIYYLELAQEDYYLDGGEPPGRWAGSAAEQMRLGEIVTDQQLRLLWQGFEPNRGARLVRNAGKTSHLPGWDLTFSADKMISTLWSQAEEADRQRIQQLHDRAVRTVIDYIENNMAWTRSRDQDGRFVFHRAKIVAATFQHGTNRNHDPNLHTHVVLLNAGLAEGNRTGALYSPAFVRQKMMLGAMYRVELAHQMEQEFGLTSSRVKSWLELDGVDKDLAKHFSSRRNDIEALLEKYGANNAKLAQAAALITRPSKEHVPRAELFEQWQAIGREMGWSREQADALVHGQTIDRQTRQLPEILESALEDTMRHQNRFTKEALLRQSLTLAQGEGHAAADVINATNAFLTESPLIKPLVVEPEFSLYTSQTMWDTEIKMVRSAERLAISATILPIDESVREAALANFNLNDEQQTAFRHLTEDKSLAVVTGLAGTGKTYLLDATRTALEAQGYRVIGATLAGKAAAELEKGAHIESQTIHSLLKDLEQYKLTLDARTALVIDEAGMVNTTMMKQLIDYADASGARLILTGDARQLQPIEAGGPFQSFLNRFDHAQLNQIRRQNDPWARDAVTAIAEGDAKRALSAYKDRDLLTVKDTPFQAMDALMETWRERASREPQHHLILASTNKTVDALNQTAQAIRHNGGHLGKNSVQVKAQTIHENDRVLFTRNSKWLGVRNGQVGTVEAIDPDNHQMRVRIDNGASIQVPTEHYNHLKLGYAITTHKSQGMTVGDDRQGDVYVYLGGGRQDRELTYVQISRAKQKTHLFADRKTGGPQLQNLIQSMTQSHQKDLVLDRHHGRNGHEQSIDLEI